MKLKINTNKIYKIIFGIILIFSIGFRLISWPNAISSVNVDEAMTAINAKTIADRGVDIYGTSFPVYLEAWKVSGQSVMQMYLMAFFIKIFGFSMITVRLPMLIISIISIVVFYDFIRRMFNKKVALFAMAFVGICPWHLLQSIWSIDCNMFPHFMLISIYLLYCGLESKKLLYLSMFFFAASMYTYGISVFIIPFFLLICAIYLFKKKLVTIKNILICIIIFLLFSAPIIVMYFINFFEIEHNISVGALTIQYFPSTVRKQSILFFSEKIGPTLVNNIKSLLKIFFRQYDYLEWNGTKTFGTVYHISIIFFFIGIFGLIKHKKNINVGTFFWLTWLMLSFITGLIINDANINRLNTIWFPTLFFSFYGIYLISKKSIIRNSIITIYSILFICFVTYLYSSYTSVIDMSWCFSQKYTDAVHFATKVLQKDVVSYCDTYGYDIYLDFQDYLDGTSSEHITDQTEFYNRLSNKKENEAFVGFINSVDVNLFNTDEHQYKYRFFGNAFIIY